MGNFKTVNATVDEVFDLSRAGTPSSQDESAREDAAPSVQPNFTSLLPQLTLEEKVGLLSGTDFVHSSGVSRLNIPPLKVYESSAMARPVRSIVQLTWLPRSSSSSTR